MSSPHVITAATFFSASLLCNAVMAQTSAGGVTRAEVKADTRAAEKAGRLTPAGQGREVKVSPRSTKTRQERKAETLAARKAGLLEPAGDAETQLIDRQLASQPSTVDRTARKSETRAEEKSRQLIPAGEGPGAPRR